NPSPAATSPAPSKGSCSSANESSTRSRTTRSSKHAASASPPWTPPSPSSSTPSARSTPSSPASPPAPSPASSGNARTWSTASPVNAPSPRPPPTASAPATAARATRPGDVRAAPTAPPSSGPAAASPTTSRSPSTPTNTAPAAHPVSVPSPSPSAPSRSTSHPTSPPATPSSAPAPSARTCTRSGGKPSNGSGRELRTAPHLGRCGVAGTELGGPLQDPEATTTVTARRVRAHRPGRRGGRHPPRPVGPVHHLGPAPVPPRPRRPAQHPRSVGIPSPPPATAATRAHLHGIPSRAAIRALRRALHPRGRLVRVGAAVPTEAPRPLRGARHRQGRRPDPPVASRRRARPGHLPRAAAPRVRRDRPHPAIPTVADAVAPAHPREAVGAGPLGRPRPVAHRPGPP